KSSRNALQNHRSERERFGKMPFIGAAVLEDFALMIKHNAFDFRLNIQTLRSAGETIDNCFQRFLADRSRLGFARVFRLKYRSGFLESGFLAGLAFFDG